LAQNLDNEVERPSYATEEANEDTAGASGDLSDTETAGVLVQSFDEASEDAAQAPDGISDGVSSWEQIKTLESGTGYYSGAMGNYTCAGVCSTGGQISFSLDYCFETKYIGLSPNTVITLVGGDLAGQNAAFTATGFYNGLSGDATITLSDATNINNSNFNGSVITLQNTGGTIATQAVLNMAYDDGSSTASGTATSTR
ncbi:hypothetical protein ACFL2T_07800, partial [Elusimicrobiota bacterium]